MESETCKRELTIEIPADIVERETGKVIKGFARMARVPGFRPGHAPDSMVRRRYHEEIKSEVVQTLVPRFFDTALKEHKWSVVGSPKFQEVNFEDRQPMTVKATFEIYPDFELGQYKGLEAEQDASSVSDAEVAEALEKLRESMGTFELAGDRASESGDYVSVSYSGSDATSPAGDPLEQREGMVHLGGKATQPAFTENLLGVKSGDIREFDVSYPEDNPRERLRGKTVHYRVEVQGVKQKVMPPLDDELAKSAGEFGTLDELRNKIRQDLTGRHEAKSKQAVERQLLDKLLEVHSFPVPERMVETQVQHKLEGLIAQFVRQGIDPRTEALDWRKLREEMTPEAEKDVRGSLILQKIADTEKIDVSDEEVDEAIRELAQESRETPAALKTRLTRDGDLDRLRLTRRTHKALDFIYANASIRKKNDSASVEQA